MGMSMKQRHLYLMYGLFSSGIERLTRKGVAQVSFLNNNEIPSTVYTM